MATHRQDMIDGEVAREMTDILRTVKDPRVNGRNALICITGAQVTKDLSLAKIFFSVVGAGADYAQTAQGLKSASGYIRSELAKRLNLRITPKLVFIKDEGAENAARISKILKDIENAGN